MTRFWERAGSGRRLPERCALALASFVRAELADPRDATTPERPRCATARGRWRCDYLEGHGGPCETRDESPRGEHRLLKPSPTTPPSRETRGLVSSRTPYEHRAISHWPAFAGLRAPSGDPARGYPLHHEIPLFRDRDRAAGRNFPSNVPTFSADSLPQLGCICRRAASTSSQDARAVGGVPLDAFGGVSWR